MEQEHPNNLNLESLVIKDRYPRKKIRKQIKFKNYKQKLVLNQISKSSHLINLLDINKIQTNNNNPNNLNSKIKLLLTIQLNLLVSQACLKNNPNLIKVNSLNSKLVRMMKYFLKFWRNKKAQLQLSNFKSSFMRVIIMKE